MPESEKGKRREPGDKAETTVTTAEGATSTRNWSIPRKTPQDWPKPELREPPKLNNLDLATDGTHTVTLRGGWGEILLTRRQHHTRGFSTQHLHRCIRP